MHNIELESIDLLKDLIYADYFILDEDVEDTPENVYKECMDYLQSWVRQNFDSKQIPLKNVKWLVEHPEKVKEVFRIYA